MLTLNAQMNVGVQAVQSIGSVRRRNNHVGLSTESVDGVVDVFVLSLALTGTTSDCSGGDTDNGGESGEETHVVVRYVMVVNVAVL